MKTKKLQLDALKPDEDNVRLHHVHAQTGLQSSLEAFGAARSIVIDADGKVLAGNGTLAAARQAGLDEVIVVPADGTQLIAVQRSDWTEEQARAYAISDNRTQELSEWDLPALRESLEDLSESTMSLPMIQDLGLQELAPAKPLEALESNKSKPSDKSLRVKSNNNSVTMSFTVDKEQQGIVMEALDKAREYYGGTQGNRLTEICKAWLGGGEDDE